MDRSASSQPWTGLSFIGNSLIVMTLVALTHVYIYILCYALNEQHILTSKAM